jgi:hypothetical protein
MWAFFGLSEEYVESVYTQIFHLKYFSGFSIIETYSLPIGLRNWFSEKLKEQMKIEKEALTSGNSNK